MRGSEGEEAERSLRAPVMLRTAVGLLCWYLLPP